MIYTNHISQVKLMIKKKENENNLNKVKNH